MTTQENPQVEKFNETPSGVSQGSALIREALDMTYTEAGARQNDSKNSQGSMAGELLGNLFGNFTIEQNGLPLAGQDVNAEAQSQSSSEAFGDSLHKNPLKSGKVELKVLPGSNENAEPTRLKDGTETKTIPDGESGALHRAKQASELHDKKPVDGGSKPENKPGDGALQRAKEASELHDKKPVDGGNKPEGKPGDGALQRAKEAFKLHDKNVLDKGEMKPGAENAIGMGGKIGKPGDQIQRTEKPFKLNDKKPAGGLKTEMGEVNGPINSEEPKDLPTAIGEKVQQRIRDLIEQKGATMPEGSAAVEEADLTESSADVDDAVNAEAIDESAEQIKTSEGDNDTATGAFSVESMMQKLNQQIEAMSQYLGFGKGGESDTAPADDASDGQEQDGQDIQQAPESHDGVTGAAETEEGERDVEKNKYSHLQNSVSLKSFHDGEVLQPLLTALSKASAHGGRDAEQQLLDELNAGLEHDGSEFRVAYGQNIIKTMGGRRLVLQNSDGQPIEVESNGDRKPVVVDFVLQQNFKPRR